MSGGIAYVYDVKETFANHCNMEMIDLDPLEDDSDKDALKALLEEHVSTTGSKVASFILGDFDNQLRNFVKVFPKDYKKVLQSKRVAEKV